MTKFPDIFHALSEPFARDEIKSLSKGKATFWYATARTYMNRLDYVLGPENWSDHYVPGETSVVCRLTITLPDGSRVTKEDAGGNAGMSDAGDDDKSGFSDAFKRACVKFGVGRFLYRDGTPDYSEAPNEAPQASQSRPPAKPEPAPMRKAGPKLEPPEDEGEAIDGPGLLMWAKDQQDATGIDVPGKLLLWGRDKGFPDQLGKWTENQAARGYAAAEKLLEKAKAAV